MPFARERPALASDWKHRGDTSVHGNGPAITDAGWRNPSAFSCRPRRNAVCRFDALPGKQFTEPVARIAESEDPTTRTMLAEIDVPNPDRMIRDQMYGRVEI